MENGVIAPHLPAPCRYGRPRARPLRKIVNAIFYVLRGGIAWRLLPNDFPPWRTVSRWFAAWRDGGGPLLSVSRRSFPLIEKVFRQPLCRRARRPRHRHRCRDRAQKPRPGQLRRQSQALGGRALLRLARPQLKARQGLRRHHRLRPRLPLRRLRHAPRPTTRPSFMTFETDS